MKRLTKISLGLLGITIILISNYPAASKNDKKDAGKDLLAIEISVPGLKPLTVPVIAAGKKSAILPLTGAKASAVKIVSRLEGDSVKFDVLAVLDPLPEARTCEIVNQLKTELVVSHTAPAGKVIQVSTRNRAFQREGDETETFRGRLSPNVLLLRCCWMLPARSLSRVRELRLLLLLA